MNLKLLLTIILLTVSHASCFALFDGEIGLGYRQDNFQWSIAGENNEPNILSELKWKDLSIALIQAKAGIEICSLYARGKADYGWIVHGHQTDQDFASDNRSSIFSSSRASSNKGNVFDLTGGIGYVYNFCFIKIASLAGYSIHQQHLHMHDLVNVIDQVNNRLGPVKGLHSNYKVRWQGPWVGVDFFMGLPCFLTLYGIGEFHWAYYNAKGHWNLRNDFLKDFKHSAKNAHGRLYTLGLQYAFAPLCGLSIEGTYQDWRSHSGVDRVFLPEGTFESRFNGANWHSYSIVGSLYFAF